MGKIRISILCFVAFFLAQWSTAQTLNWDYTLIQNDERLSGAYPDMVIGSNGTIHISYWDREGDQMMYARKTIGGNWVRENVDLQYAAGFKSSIVLDATGRPHIAYFQNDNGNIQVRYSIRTATATWAVETIPGDAQIGWGEYGPNAPNNFTERIKPSIDLVLKTSGEPQILFFDAWMDRNAFPSCTSGSLYGWKLHQAWKSAGVWQVSGTLGKIKDKYGNCGGDTLPYGDRYGEYVNFIQRKDGSLAATMMSRWNNEVLLMENVPGNDTAWTYRVVDSLNRCRPNYTWSREWFSMEGIALYESSDSVLHFAFGTSLFYGENFCCTDDNSPPWVTTMVYGRIDSSGVHYKNFGSTLYRNHMSIAGNGPDTTFVVFAELGSGTIMMMDTINGDTATYDTLYQGTAISTCPVSVYDDSVYVLIYDDLVERLVMAKRHVDGGNWNYEAVNYSENLGESLDGLISQSVSDTAYAFAFNDVFTGNLYFSEGTRNGSNWNINTSQIDPTYSNFRALSFEKGPGGENMLLYAAGGSQNLRLAIESGGIWQYEIVDTNDFVTFTQLALSATDTIHIAWFDANSKCLSYGKRHFSSSTWIVDTLDCGITAPVGQYPSLKLDAQGKPHIAYFDEELLSLKYIEQNPTTLAWEIDTVYTALPSPVGKFASLELTSANEPMIAFLDGQRTIVYLAERGSGGAWSFTALDSSSVYNLGRPIELEIDQFDNPWVAYNSFSNYDRIRLMHRDSIWRVVSVSTEGRIANAFRFQVVENDLYILGKQNEPGNTGVGMLYSGNGLYIGVDEPLAALEKPEIFAWPNPVSQNLNIRLRTPDPAKTSLVLRDLNGRVLREIWLGKTVPAGEYSTELNVENLASGMYFLQLSGENARQILKIFITD